MNKKIIALALITLMLFGVLSGCAPAPTDAANTPAPTAAATPDAGQRPESIEFTDSAGRTVTVPGKIDKIAVSGPLAQIALFALAPDKLAGVATKWDATAEMYLATEYYNLPELGQIYGTKGELNLETLLASGAQIVIDVGEPKDTIVEDFDALQKQTGLPFVHFTATMDTMGDAYRKLGELLGMAEEAEALAAYCERIYKRTTEIASSVEKANVLYCLGDKGQSVIAKGSYHAELIDLLSNNVAVVNDPSGKGTGNEVDMEQIFNWDPDVILFAPDSIYATVALEKTWQQVRAIQNGDYYEVPMGPYNWMGFPPSVQRYLGMMWMQKLLYPDAAQYDLYADVAEYFKLFYHADLSRGQYDALVQNSIGINEMAELIPGG